jgi:hypothetical protein
MVRKASGNQGIAGGKSVEEGTRRIAGGSAPVSLDAAETAETSESVKALRDVLADPVASSAAKVSAAKALDVMQSAGRVGSGAVSKMSRAELAAELTLVRDRLRALGAL